MLSIVVPTYNERGNIQPLLARLDDALSGVSWELIVVDDDSPDRTWALVDELSGCDARIRCLRRIKRRGLAGACIEGALAATGRCVAVLDADLQHDETLLARMLDALGEDRADLVIGSRYLDGEQPRHLSRFRLAGSRAANWLSRALFAVTVSDPMSGFFMIRRECLELLAPSLSPHGFKILLDILATSRGRLQVAELHFEFRGRVHGESKLDTVAALDFVGLLIAKISHNVISPRFFLFAVVGAFGLIVHFVALYAGTGLFDLPFETAQPFAAVVAMVSNYFLNNRLAFRDRSLSGPALLRGLLVYIAVCSIGVLANIGVAYSLYAQQPVWWFAGLAGAAMSVAWNYAMSSLLVWEVR